MPSPDLLARLRVARREPLFAALPVRLGWGRPELERLLPHRAPLLLLDSVDAASPDGRAALGSRRLDPADPVFAGHFPGDPVYPGALLLEMAGQLGLCLGPALAARRPPDSPRPVRLLRIHGADFVAPARPGDDLTVAAELIEDDGWTCTTAAQVLRGRQVLCAALLDAVWMEDT